jgi:hypothetical protein
LRPDHSRQALPAQRPPLLAGERPTCWRSAVERHIVPSLGSIKLAKLSATRIEAFLAEKAETGRLNGNGGLGPTSIRRLLVTLTKSLGAAVRKGLLPSNPMDRVERTGTPREDVTESVWTPQQMADFSALSARTGSTRCGKRRR